LFGIANRIGKIYREYPRTFWALVAAGFIDTIGGTLLFPFFSLYVTQRFGVGMTEAGLLLGVFSLAGMAGGALGGALTDRFGRRGIVLFGLVFSAVSALTMGLVNDLVVFYPLGAVVGLLGSLADPARQAIVADVLPENQRAEGFGLMRVAGNLAWIIGPTIGGFVANYSFMMLFILDTITSCLTAVVIYLLVPETKPQAAPGAEPQGMVQVFAGYRHVFRDGLFMGLIGCSMLVLIVYQQLYSTLAVYLRDVHGISPQGFGFLISVNAGLVVLLQLWVTRRIKARPPLLMMAVGAILYGAGFGMIGFVSAYWLFVVAAIIITAGEMIAVPVSQSLAAMMAPADMRGRYMAVFGLAWAIPSTIGPLAAGLVMDNLNPNLVWYAAIALCAAGAAGYYLLHTRAGERLSVTADAAEPAP
jgi:MFS family permease